MWRLLLSMKGLCHVELADSSESRQPPSRWERTQKRRVLAENEIFRLRFRLGRRRLRRTSRSAQNDSRRACGLSRCPERPDVSQSYLTAMNPRKSTLWSKNPRFPFLHSKTLGFSNPIWGLKFTTLFSASIHYEALAKPPRSTRRSTLR